jgi:uncharacterized spore protein YtfJ
MTNNHTEIVESQAGDVSGEDTSALAERLLDQIGRAARADAVFGTPVTSHGRTVIPVSRAYFALGGGGGKGEGNAKQEGRSIGSGGGGGGIGFTLASGYIEISAEGTRYVAVTSNRDRIIGVAAGLVFGLILARVLKR